uniref:Uncharacterized protein n=1 Tax=Leersia perrieri TaxID=77586 RepID=A0A0D9XCG4_9ORYZ
MGGFTMNGDGEVTDKSCRRSSGFACCLLSAATSPASFTPFSTQGNADGEMVLDTRIGCGGGGGCVIACIFGFVFILYMFFTIILPPLPILVLRGCEKEFWICLLLTFCGYIPGIIYSFCITKFNLSST